MSYAYLKEQIEGVKNDIAMACEKIDIDAHSISLIAVTKTYEPDVINASIEYGITDIAENRVQEIIRKYDAIHKGVKWHLIGHLQTNKVKFIIDKVDLIHSVDSLKLAEEISNRASQIGKIQDVLIQVNVADETQKFGVSPEAFDALFEAMATLPNIRICGLMNIAPFIDDEHQLREDFKVMHFLYQKVKNCTFSNVEAKFLSMGMSNDYKIAIEEGSNMIRIGTKIFGKRS